MAYINPPKPAIKTILKQLGDPYIIREIDGENVIYRSFKNGYEFEVSGLDNYRKKTIKATLYVWKKGRLLFENVETVEGIDSFEKLKQILDTYTEKYLKL